MFSQRLFCLQDEKTFVLYLLYILCLSICNKSGGVNKVCFVDLVLLPSDHHILLAQLLSTLTREGGSTATAARLSTCVCVRARMHASAHSFPSPLPFFQFHS